MHDIRGTHVLFVNSFDRVADYAEVANPFLVHLLDKISLHAKMNVSDLLFHSTMTFINKDVCGFREDQSE